MTVLIRLLEACNFNRSELGRRLGALARQTPAEWVENRYIPPEYWDKAIKVIPDLTIEDCYDEFIRKRQAAKNRFPKNRKPKSRKQ